MEKKPRTYLFYGSLALVFLCSRFLFRQAGITFQDDIVFWGWQVLDTDLLWLNLSESLWYLHAQPPLYNLFIGLVIKMADGRHTLVFTYLYLLFGLATALLLANSLRTIRIPAVPAFLLTVLFFCSPAAILFENFAFYTQLELFCLMALLWAGLRYFLGLQKRKYLWILFGFALALCLMRSMYHWVFFVSLVALIVYFSPRKKQVLYIAAIPFLVLMGWYTKNLLLFGNFSASSWTGMNMARMCNTGDTELGKIGIWAAPEKYDSLVHFSPSPYDAPAVSARYKSNGEINFNYYGYLEVSQRFGQEARAHIRKHPEQYLDSVQLAVSIFFEPPSQLHHGFLETNYKKLSTWNKIYHLGYNYPTGQIGANLIALSAGWHALVFVLGLVLLALRPVSKPHKAGIALILFLMIYVFVVGNLFELSENNRFRYPTIPVVLLFTAWEIRLLWQWVRKRKVSTSAPTS